MPTYTNKFVNSELVGATVGTIGSGGAFPTGWSGDGAYAGFTISWEILSLTTTNLQYIMQVRMICANTSGADAYPKMYMGDISSVASSTLHQIALWTRTVSSVGSTYFAWLAAVQYTSGYGYLDNTVNLYNLTGTFARGSTSFTTNATTGIITPYLGWGIPTGQSLTTVFEVSQPMFVPGSWLPSYIPTVNATPVSRDLVAFRGHNRTYLEM